MLFMKKVIFFLKLNYFKNIINQEEIGISKGKKKINPKKGLAI